MGIISVTTLLSWPALTEHPTDWPRQSERADIADLLGDIRHQGAEHSEHNMGQASDKTIWYQAAGVGNLNI